MPIPVPIHDSLRQARAAGGTPWLDRLPDLVRAACSLWGLEISGSPYEGGTCAWVAPVDSPAGSAVLKVTWPHSEAAGEAAALRWWDGAGAARVLAEDADNWVMLLERCEPGTPLRDAGRPSGAGLDAGAAVLRSLWARGVPADAHSFDSLVAVCDGWADLATTRTETFGPDLVALGVDPGLLRLGVDLLHSLPRSADRPVLLHGDANPGNLLASEREPFLAIDPKPMIGDPAYDPWPLVSQLDDPFATPDGTQQMPDRLRRVADQLDLPASRLAAWAVARDVEGGLWSAAHGDHAGGADWISHAAVVAPMLG